MLIYWCKQFVVTDYWKLLCSDGRRSLDVSLVLRLPERQSESKATLENCAYGRKELCLSDLRQAFWDVRQRKKTWEKMSSDDAVTVVSRIKLKHWHVLTPYVSAIATCMSPLNFVMHYGNDWCMHVSAYWRTKGACRYYNKGFYICVARFLHMWC